MLANKQFNPDELQHLHIAWKIAQGEILYHDFWEHHGPLYSLLNGVLMHVIDPSPSIRALYAFRLLSLAATIGIMVITWLTARQLSLSRLGASLAVAACSSLFFVLDKGMEMRPDPLQALFWFGGLYLLLRNQSDGDLRRAVFSGALFTLAIMANSKAGIGPFFVVVFYLVGHWICGLSWRDLRRDLIGLIIGGSLAATPFLIYFWANDALFDMVYYNFIWNVQANYYWSTELGSALPNDKMSIAVEYALFFAQNQLAFLLLTVLGVTLWVGKLRESTDQAARQQAWLFIFVTIGTSFGWLTGQYSQFFLMFLPFWSILVGYALVNIAGLIPQLKGNARSAFTILIAAAAGVGMLWYSVSNTTFKEETLMRVQKEFTRWFIEHVDRDEPVVLTWSSCGGYMFNPSIGHHWVAMPIVSDIVEKFTGKHPFDESFINQMEDLQVRYVIGSPGWKTDGLTDGALEYLNANFDYSACLWTRKKHKARRAIWID